MGARARVANFDDVAQLYDTTRGGEPRGRRQARGLASLLTRDELVLDVGAGTGLVALGLQELGFGVVAVDIAAGMLRQAHARLGPRAVRADAACLPLADGAVSQCLTVWLLQAVAEPGAVLAEVARVLRPGGRLLVLPADCPLNDEADWVTRLLDDLQARVRARNGEATSTGGPGRDAESLDELARAAGLRLTATHWLDSATCEMAPAEAARDLERRPYRWLADLDEDAWSELVVPVIARLTAGNAERPIVRRTRPEPVYVLQR